MKAVCVAVVAAAVLLCGCVTKGQDEVSDAALVKSPSAASVDEKAQKLLAVVSKQLHPIDLYIIGMKGQECCDPCALDEAYCARYTNDPPTFEDLVRRNGEGLPMIEQHWRQWLAKQDPKQSTCVLAGRLICGGIDAWAVVTGAPPAPLCASKIAGALSDCQQALDSLDESAFNLLQRAADRASVELPPQMSPRESITWSLVAFGRHYERVVDTCEQAQRLCSEASAAGMRSGKKSGLSIAELEARAGFKSRCQTAQMGPIDGSDMFIDRYADAIVRRNKTCQEIIQLAPPPPLPK